MKHLLNKRAHAVSWHILTTALTGAVALGLPGLAHAIKVNAANTEDTVTKPTCSSGKYKDCTSKATLSKTSLSAPNNDFKAAFDDWNKGNAAGSKWTLDNGGNLPGGELTVGTFKATAADASGGLELVLNWTYNGADKSDYVWSQGLSVNYRPGGTGTVPAFPALDENVANGLTPCNNKDVSGTDKNYHCAPAYPYQFGDRRLSDVPSGPWPDGSFSAFAFLSKIDRTNRKLTIYEGFNYGFTLSATAVPEPGVWAMGLAGLGVLGLRRQRRTPPALA